jgi:uracil-DNA glycosylase
MDLTPLQEVRCAIIAQDPYPNPALAMGLAYSVPNLVKEAIPPTLRSIFMEYVNDLHLPYPNTTDLTPWAKQGILLWNAVPTCHVWESMSHDWREWERLTSEVISAVDEQSSVIVLMGSVARRFASKVSRRSELIETSHPSPRANSSNKCFSGSRMFSKINDLLGNSPIDWRLP